MKRKRFSATSRFRILHEQDFVCAICTNKIPVEYHIDHIVPLWSGGTNDRSNLQGVCVPCHGHKTGTEANTRSRVTRARAKRSIIRRFATRVLGLIRRLVGAPKRTARPRLGS